MTTAQLKVSLNLWRRRERYRQRKLDYYHQKNDAEKIAKWQALHKAAVSMVHRRQHQLTPLRMRAYNVARGLVGVMEEGGNNVGPMVSKIIRANGGTPGEPWCGDFQAYCYRLAGSKAVQRAWASVRMLGGLSGIRRTRNPVAGNLVRYTFDHVGMFHKWIDRSKGEFETIEGNTGRVGAVSDSKTGGDGVYIKRRNISQVNDFLEVLR